jgi:hypothetical protein
MISLVGVFALVAASLACAATPVQSTADGSGVVRVGPLVGGIQRYDTWRGRFSLRVGKLRANHQSQKIAWWPDAGAAIGDSLIVVGERLSLPKRTFTQVFPAAQESGSTRMMFPSEINPPSTGCWRLTFTTGPTTALLYAWVRPKVPPLR